MGGSLTFEKNLRKCKTNYFFSCVTHQFFIMNLRTMEKLPKVVVAIARPLQYHSCLEQFGGFIKKPLKLTFCKTVLKFFKYNKELKLSKVTRKKVENFPEFFTIKQKSLAHYWANFSPYNSLVKNSFLLGNYTSLLYLHRHRFAGVASSLLASLSYFATICAFIPITLLSHTKTKRAR